MSNDPVDPPSAGEGTPAAAAASPASEEEVKAQDQSATAAADAKPVEETTEALSSLAVTVEPSSPESQAAPEVPVAPVQQLPLNLPAGIANNLAALNDEAAAEALDNDFLSLLPPAIIPRIDKLKSLNDARSDILEEYRIERAALEAKFMERIKPLYEERKGVVSGQFDGAIDEAAKKKNAEENKDVVQDADVVEEEDVKGIPQFWACAMGHVDVIAELITEADVDCLDHLTDVTCNDFPDGLGFELQFHFSSNPFFTNPILSKRYEVPNLLTEDEPILQKVTGTEIQWKTGQSLTYREITKKQRKKGGPNAGQVRSITKKERSESFFHFFTPPKMPGLMEVMDEDEADAVEEQFDHDYDVAQAVRGHLIPRAVLWFTGEAMTEDYDDDMIEEMMRQEGEEEVGQFNFNPHAGGADAGSNPFPPSAEGDGENPECKQN